MEKVGEAAAAGAVVLHELRLERATLEEAFLAITGTAGAVGVEPPQRPDEVAP